MSESTSQTTSRPTSADRFAVARAVADAVLYEGYVLYPYRASARKNHVRWQFGVLVPREYAAANDGERSGLRTEVIIDPGADAHVIVRVRCLQLQARTIEERVEDGADGDRYEPVERLDVDDVTWVSWDEAVEHTVDLPPLPLLPVSNESTETVFFLDMNESVEEIAASDGAVRGRASRRSETVEAVARITTAWAEGTAALVKVTVEVENATTGLTARADRDAALARSLLAVHTLLAVDDGQFVSLLDPPEFAAAAVAGCHNEGTFPVLIGEPTEASVMLSSPIILYDYPAVAPESAGDFCDATEIDEILALRVLTLTDEEKAEARGTDRRAAAIVDRCDDLPPEVWERLHGAVRSLQPSSIEPSSIRPGGGEPDEATEALPWWDPGVDGAVDPWTDTTWVGGVEVGKGTSVRLRPSRRADAHDLFLAGRTATVAGVFKDVDGDEHLAVTLDDDPASEALEWQRRYLYFHPDEVEVLS